MKYYITLTLLLICLFSHAQRLKVGIESGLATFSMHNLKDLNESVIDNMSFVVKQTDDFPPTIYYRPSLSWVYEKMSFGFIYTYMTTGSRISSKDYSGEYKFDILAHSHSPAFFYEYRVYKRGSDGLYLRAMAGENLSSVSLREYFTIYDENYIDEDYDFNSQNYFIEPSLRYTLPMKFIILEANLGYHMVISNNALHLKDNKDATLVNSETGSKIKPAWDGIRIGIGVSYYISKQ